MASVRFQLDTAGLREICKSDGMQSVLREAAEGLCAGANADAYTHAGRAPGQLHVRGGTFETAPYGAGVDVLDRTAVGVVYTRTPVGAMNEARFKSLSRQNH